MKQHTIIIGLVFALFVAGCTSSSTESSRVVHTYVAENSESLVFLANSGVFHTCTVDGKEERHFLGYYYASSNDHLRRGFAGPDTSPFIGTSFQFSDDGATVTANWDNFRKPKDTWQITYRMNPKAN